MDSCMSSPDKSGIAIGVTNASPNLAISSEILVIHDVSTAMFVESRSAFSPAKKLSPRSMCSFPLTYALTSRSIPQPVGTRYSDSNETGQMARFIASGGYNTEISRKKVAERDVQALAKHARDGTSD